MRFFGPSQPSIRSSDKSLSPDKGRKGTGDIIHQHLGTRPNILGSAVEGIANVSLFNKRKVVE